MAEIWAAAVATVGSAYMSSRASGKNQDKQMAADAETARVQSEEGRRTFAYEAELSDYYGQLAKQRRKDARSETFGKYSKIAKPEDYVEKPIMIAKPDIPIPVVREPVKKKKGKK